MAVLDEDVVTSPTVGEIRAVLVFEKLEEAENCVLGVEVAQGVIVEDRHWVGVDVAQDVLVEDWHWDEVDVGVGEPVEEKHRVADIDWEALPVEVMVAELETSPVGDTRAELVLVKLEEAEV